MKYFFFILFSISIIFPNYALGQIKNKGELFVLNYYRKDYKAAKQNWAVLQDKLGLMYFGNTRGVLTFDGHNWKLIPVKNNSLARSLAIDSKGRIYVGARKEFGYLKADSLGNINYLSLLNKIQDKEFSFKDIGRIFIIDKDVYYISKGVIFKYVPDKDSLTLIKNKNLLQVYVAGKRIFVNEKNIGLSEYVNGKFIVLPEGQLLRNKSIRAIIKYDNRYLISTLDDGFYIFDNHKIEKIQTAADDFLNGKKVMACIRLKNGYFAIGTFSSGLLIIDEHFKPIQYVSTQNGLQNNGISAIYQDNRQNIWLSLSNGISEVLSSLPISYYNKDYGLTGTVYNAKVFYDKLYLATSKGAFERSLSNYESPINKLPFKIIGDPAQVFTIDTVFTKILIAHNLGVRVLDHNKIKDLKIDKIPVYTFLRLKNHPDLIIVGTRRGLMLLQFKTKKIPKWKKRYNKKKNELKGEFVFLRYIKGVNERCRHILIDENNDIWLENPAKGIARINLNGALDSASIFWYGPGKGISNIKNNHVFIIDKKVIVSTPTGLYKYDAAKNRFKKEEALSELFDDNAKIEELVQDGKGNIWFKQKRKLRISDNEEVYEMGVLQKQADGSFYQTKAPFYKLRNNIYSISPINDKEVIIGNEIGFTHYDSEIEKDHYKTFYTILNEVKFVSNDSVIFAGTYMDSLGYMSLHQPDYLVKQIPYHLNDIRFSFTALFYEDFENTQFKFFLEGYDKDWSDWRSVNYKEYSNLQEGDYIFKVKAKNIYGAESVTATYKFTILPPWYRTIWAFILYIILAALIIWGIVRLSVMRLRKQKEYLEMLVQKRTAEINRAKEEIEEANKMLQKSNAEIKEKNKNITASITYAKRIQEAMLPFREIISKSLSKYFILFKPRDIVSGDFYWFAEKNGKTIITAVDCTGHGVPGAFMSMIGSEILTTIVNQGITKPSEILDLKNKYVRKALKQDQTDNQDGMDMALCTIDKKTKTVEYAGARNPLIYIKNGELFHVKADKQGIGGKKTDLDKSFTNHVISYADTETFFYIFSDGFQDQFGGPKNRKFMIKRMKELFLEHHKKPMKEQEKIYNYTIENWMKDVEQTDDIIVIGFALGPEDE